MKSLPISIFPWFRASFFATDNFLTIESINNVWIFPAGKKTEQIPIKDISSCSVSTFYDESSILVGIVLIIICIMSGRLLPFRGLLYTLIVVFSAIFGVLLFLSGISAKIVIEKKGLLTQFYVPFYGRSQAREISEWINKLLIT